MLDLEKAQRLSLTMQVEVRLKNALIVGSLRPGARLVTKEIADQLGISITPVREALLRLVSSGALNATPAQAFLVPEISEARYDEVTKIRKNLEGMAAEAAAKNMTPARMARLRELCDAFREAKMSDSVEQALQANRAFRFQLYNWAEMPTLVSLIEQLWMRIGPCFNYLYPQSDDFVRGHHNYDDLLEALEAGDGEAAARAVHKAINDGALILKNSISANPHTGKTLPECVFPFSSPRRFTDRAAQRLRTAEEAIIMHISVRRHASRSRIRRILRAWLTPHPPETRALMLESFIPYGHLYGLDFGNIDPGLHRPR